VPCRRAQRHTKRAAALDPARAATVLLARHGQTTWNAEHRLQGHRDAPLSAVGQQEALEVR
jgi:hypothetical protein